MEPLDWKAIERRNRWWDAGDVPPSLPRRAAMGLSAALRRQRFEVAPGQPRLGFALRGLRRVGKTTLMRQVAGQLLDQRLWSGDEVLLLDFESAVFEGRRGDPSAIEAAFSMYVERLQPRRTPLLLLDEVQVVEGWARWVRDALETGRAHIVVTGSSSRLLEPELATVLVGRMRSTTLWPMSIGETLDSAAALGVVPVRVETAEERCDRALASVIRTGGLPWIVERQLQAARLGERRDLGQGDEPFLRDILASILKDISTRHEVRHQRGLERVVQFALQQTGCELSLNKLKTRFGIGIDQAARYLDFADEAYLVQRLERFSVHAGERARAPTKVYAVDLGLRNAMSLHGHGDEGHLVETLVHNALRADSDAKLWSFRSRQGYECDFVRPPGETVGLALQVCVGDELPEREVRGLQVAMEALDLQEGVILTRHLRADQRLADGRRLLVRPAAVWLLALEDARRAEVAGDVRR